jgi:hypothetical protein
MNFQSLSKNNLHSIVKEYNLHTKITGYYKMKKDDLISEMEKHLSIENGAIFIKNNKKLDVEISQKLKKTTEEKPLQKEKTTSLLKDTKNETLRAINKYVSEKNLKTPDDDTTYFIDKTLEKFFKLKVGNLENLNNLIVFTRYPNIESDMSLKKFKINKPSLRNFINVKENEYITGNPSNIILEKIKDYALKNGLFKDGKVKINPFLSKTLSYNVGDIGNKFSLNDMIELLYFTK